MVKHLKKKSKKNILFTGYRKKIYKNTKPKLFDENTNYFTAEYEGGFFNGKKDGYGKMRFNLKEYNYDDDDFGFTLLNNKTNYLNNYDFSYDWVFYEGEWKKGNPHGNGTLKFSNGSYCSGNWYNGFITNGTFKYFDGRVYKGDFARMHYADLFYITPFRHGYGTMFKNFGEMVEYDGEWKSFCTSFSMLNSKHYGVEKDGQLEYGFPHGIGMYITRCGNFIEGTWNNGIIKRDVGDFNYIVFHYHNINVNANVSTNININANVNSNINKGC